MDDIYGRMTNPLDPQLKMERRAPDAVASAGVAMVLPEVSTNLLAGLMETLAGEPFNGKADLPEIADELSAWRWTSCSPLVGDAADCCASPRSRTATSR